MNMPRVEICGMSSGARVPARGLGPVRLACPWHGGEGGQGCITDRHPCPQEMVITNLQPETAYSITSRHTMKGDGARSKPKVVVTKGAGTRLSLTLCPQERPAEFLSPWCMAGRRVHQEGGAEQSVGVVQEDTQTQRGPAPFSSS